MKCRLFLVAFGLSVAVLAWFITTHPKEPTYDGKPLSYWLEHVRIINAVYSPDTEPFRAIGSNAVPRLIEELQARDSTFKVWAAQIAAKQSFIRFNHTPASIRHSRAILACAAIGPAGSNVIPALERLLEETPPGSDACTALGKMGPPGIIPLTRALTNAIPNVRYWAEPILRNIISKDPTNVVVMTKFLVLKLNDPSGEIRWLAAKATATMKDLPASIVSTLEQHLDDPDIAVRRLVVTGIVHISVEWPRFQSEKPFVPALRRALTNADAVVRAAGTNGLEQLRAPMTAPTK